VPKLKFPELYSFAKNKVVTLQKAKLMPIAQPSQLLHLPISNPTFQQLTNISAAVLFCKEQSCHASKG